jgi:peptidoglycan/LPS O-acetylase OafA/YrhL
MLATGPAIHLWFLPFAFFIGLIVKRGPPGYAVLTLLTGVFFFANFEMKPLAQYASVMPAVMVGIVMAISKKNKVAAAAAVLALGVTADISLILGGAVAALALIFPIRISPALHILGRASLTMYLAHPAISAALKYAHLDPMPKAVAVVLVTITVAVILDWMPAKRLLVLK